MIQAVPAELQDAWKVGAKGKISDKEYAHIMKLAAGVSTRFDFLKLFIPCGLTSPQGGSYRYIKNHSVGIDVQFSCERGSDERLIPSQDDKILKISKPYWQPIFAMDQITCFKVVPSE